MSSKTLTQNNEIITMEDRCSKFCLFNSNIHIFAGFGATGEREVWGRGGGVDVFHFHYDKRHLFIFEFGICFGFYLFVSLHLHPESGIWNPPRERLVCLPKRTNPHLTHTLCVIPFFACVYDPIEVPWSWKANNIPCQ